MSKLITFTTTTYSENPQKQEFSPPSKEKKWKMVGKPVIIVRWEREETDDELISLQKKAKDGWL